MKAAPEKLKNTTNQANISARVGRIGTTPAVHRVGRRAPPAKDKRFSRLHRSIKALKAVKKRLGWGLLNVEADGGLIKGEYSRF